MFSELIRQNRDLTTSFTGNIDQYRRDFFENMQSLKNVRLMIYVKINFFGYGV